MKKWISILISALFLGGCTGNSDVYAPQNGSYRQVGMDEAIRIMDEETGYIILDVRRPDECASGHIPGAINIPVTKISNMCATMDRSAPIFTYCLSGARSTRATAELQRMGFVDVHNIGGISTYNGQIER